MMSDEELVAYCRQHSQTHKALFSNIHVRRMIALAGYPKDYDIDSITGDFISVRSYLMHPLCDLATKRLAEIKNKPQKIIHVDFVKKKRKINGDSTCSV